MYYGLTSLGVVHTIISLLALIAGAIALIRDGKITWNNGIGKFYIVSTILVCVTGFGIFQHGGFGKPHALGILTLIVIAIAFATGKNSTLFGKYTPYVEMISYTTTFFFHWVPTVTETATRLPLDAPLASSPDDPRIQGAIGVCLVLFLIGSTLQVRSLRTRLRTN